MNQFVHLRSGMLPSFVIKSDAHTMIDLLVPFPVLYNEIQTELEEDFVNMFCESLRNRLQLKNENGILSDTDHCSGSLSFVLRRGVQSCDDVVPLSFNLDICYIIGESVQEVKSGVIECLKNLFHQTITMNYRSGCSLW